jgi:hypothetical protein
MNSIVMHCRLMDKILHCVQNDTNGYCNAMKRHRIISSSPRQSTQGCGAAQYPVANGRPTGQGYGDCTVFQQPVAMRTYGVQGRSALAGDC